MMSSIQISPQELGRTIACEIEPHASQSDLERSISPSDLQTLCKHNYHLLSIPKQYGGLGYSLRDCVVAQMELAQGNASVAMIAAMQLQIFGHHREVHEWPEKIIRRLSILALNEGALFNSAASEPELGSPSRGGIFQTRAESDPQSDSIRINGRKTWITGGKHLSYLLVRLDYQGKAGIALVENHLKGMQWEETWEDSLSLRASESHDVVFKDVLVPKDNLFLPLQGKSQPNLWFPMMLASVYLGVAIAARNKLVAYTHERIPTALGKPIATLPSIQRQIGELEIPLQAARALLMEVASEWDPSRISNQDYYPRVAAAKQFVVQAAAEATEHTLKIVGGRSLTARYPFERYFRDVRAGMMQPPSGDTAYETVGKSILAAEK